MAGYCVNGRTIWVVSSYSFLAGGCPTSLSSAAVASRLTGVRVSALAVEWLRVPVQPQCCHFQVVSGEVAAPVPALWGSWADVRPRPGKCVSLFPFLGNTWPWHLLRGDRSVFYLGVVVP